MKKKLIFLWVYIYKSRTVNMENVWKKSIDMYGERVNFKIMELKNSLRILALFLYNLNCYLLFANALISFMLAILHTT